jgi:hypothetical protein
VSPSRRSVLGYKTEPGCQAKYMGVDRECRSPEREEQDTGYGLGTDALETEQELANLFILHLVQEIEVGRAVFSDVPRPGHG